MKINISLLSLLLILNLTFFQTAHADDNRSNEPFGLYLSSGPYELFSLNAAYNLDRFLRVTGGLGYSHYVAVSSVGSGPSFTEIIVDSGINDAVLDASLKAMVPHWEFSPVIGLGLSNLTTLNPYGTYLPDILFTYAIIGFDYQAKDGFDMGLEICFPFYDIIDGTPFNDFGSIGRINIGEFF